MKWILSFTLTNQNSNHHLMKNWRSFLVRYLISLQPIESVANQSMTHLNEICLELLGVRQSNRRLGRSDWVTDIPPKLTTAQRPKCALNFYSRLLAVLYFYRIFYEKILNIASYFVTRITTCLRKLIVQVSVVLRKTVG